MENAADGAAALAEVIDRGCALPPEQSGPTEVDLASRPPPLESTDRSCPTNARRAAARHAGLAFGLRAVRALLVADASADLDRADPAERVRRLVAALLETMQFPAGVWVPAGWTPESEIAPCEVGLSEAERSELASDLGVREGVLGFSELAQRERRPCILSASRADAVASWWRRQRPDLTAVLALPLYDVGESGGVLLACSTRAATSSPHVVQAMAPAVRLLAVLLSPGRSAMTEIQGARDRQAHLVSEAERLAVEVEDLRLHLAEAEDVAREAEAQKEAATSALQTEVEALRARLGRVEAEATSRGLELEVRRVDDETRHGLEQACAERDSRIRELEAGMAEVLAKSLESARRVAELEALLAAESVSTPASAGADALPALAGGGGELPSAPASGFGIDDPEVLELAGEAVEAVERDYSAEADAAVAPDLGADLEGGAAAAAADEQEAWQVDSVLSGPALIATETDVELAAALVEAAGHAGASVWDGAAELSGLDAAVVAVNLVAPELPRLAAAAASLGGLVRTVAYAWDAESRTGFLIGNAELVRRPIDPAGVVAQLRRSVAGKIERVMIVSATLRELGPLREALGAIGASSCIACDARQAIELLDIVKRPDAFLIDLALPGGDGFALAALAQAKPDLAQATMGLLLPAEADVEGLRAHLIRGAGDACFGAADLKRTVGHALAVLAQRLAG